VPCSSLLNTQPPDGGEGPELPLKALSERFEVSLAKFGILWILLGVGQRHEDHPPFEGLEGASVDASETPQEVPSACPGETPYPISYASTVTQWRTRRTEPVTSLKVFEGKCRYRPSYGRGDIGTRLR
jgi:hypothetical protein